MKPEKGKRAVDKFTIKREPNGRFAVGTGAPGGFHVHPENATAGGHWKKEDTPRYQLQEMIKLSETEIVKIATDKNAPLFSRRLARSLLKENEWRVSESMINQVYGKPREVIEHLTPTPTPLIDLRIKKEEIKDEPKENENPEAGGQ